MRTECPKCGTIAKYEKRSCCGHGGSWFGNCGSTSNTKGDHTWYEGIRACDVQMQYKEAVARQSQAAQRPNAAHGRDVPNHMFTVASSKRVSIDTAAHTKALISTTTGINSSTPNTADSTATTRITILNIVVHIKLLQHLL